MKVGLLQCDDLAAEEVETYGNYPALYSRLLHSADDTIEVETWRVHEGELPDDTLAVDAWLISGSKASAYDGADWIESLKSFVRLLWDERRPLVGICFGHQIMAAALGGRVEKCARGWGLGTAVNRVGKVAPWMDPERETFRLVVVHQDQVTSLPATGSVLAGSEFCPNFMVQYDECFLGIQGHPEFPIGLARLLHAERESLLAEAARSSQRASLEETPDDRLVAVWMVDFMEHAMMESQSHALIRSG